MQRLGQQWWKRRSFGTLLVAALAVAPPLALQAQSATGSIVGRVSDARAGEAVAGASVQVEGTRFGAITGTDGRYRVTNVPAGAHVVTVRRVGYASSRQNVTVAAGADQALDYSLQISVVALDQVVVTGTAGVTERRSIGNAVSIIDAPSDVEKSAAPDLSNLLRSRAPGVDIQPISGRIGAGPAIQIRGPSSIGLSNNPLIYIDGVRVNNATNQGPASAGTGALGTQGASVESRMNDINPEDIESIEIIKGPAAATLYGTEASNGVIQIITKRGASDRTQVRADVSAGPLWFRDAAGRVPTNYDKDKTTGNIVTWNGVQAQSDSGTPIFKTGLERHYTLSVSGGRNESRYYASGAYENDYGVEPNNLQRQATGHVNLTTPVGGNTSVSTSLNFVDMSTHLGADVGASALLGAVAGHSLLFPAAQGFYPNYPPAVPQTLYDNAAGINRFTGSTTVDNQVGRWFTQRAILGLDYTGEDQRAIEHFAPPTLASFLPASSATGRIGQTLRRTNLISADYSGTLKSDVTSSINEALSVGGQFINSEVNASFLGGTGFPALGVETVSAAANPSASTQSQTVNTTIGGYAQEQLAWRDRLFVVGAVRVDNNSAFGQNFKWVTYPKLSLSYVLSDEPFWHWGGTVNSLRLRAAYGAAGRQPAAFSALQTFAPVTGPNGANAITPANLGNPSLQPERSIESEIGFESNLFNRLGIDFTYYHKRTKNEIVNQPVAPSTGFSGNQLLNLGEVVNHGIELQATYQAIERRSFGWSVSGNLTTVSDVIKSNITNAVTSAGQYNIVGYPIQGLWARRVVSSDRDANGLPTNALCDGGTGGAGVACATAPFAYIGTPTPKLSGALANTFTIGRSLRLYALVDAKQGHRIWNQSEEIRCGGLAGAPLCRANYYPLEYSAEYLAEASGQAIAGGMIDEYMQPGDFLKLRELSATYTIPSRFVPTAGPASITFAARELHTWTKYKGIDPESTTGASAGAIDQAVIPPLTRFVVTFNFGW